MTIEKKAGELERDWTSFVRSLPASFQKQLELREIAPADRVLIKTRNTLYLFTWKGACRAELRTDNAKAPSGSVQIMGCSFGLSSSIRPDALFCGGNLEFTHREGEKTWTTSEIEEIYHLHHSEKNSLHLP